MRSLSKPFDTLVSFHYFGGNQEPWVRRLAAAGCRTIGDSGAYSAMSLGKPVDLDQFAEWAERNRPYLGTDGSACVIRSTHSCMSLRGVKATGAAMVTSSLTGAFRTDTACRAEFMSLTHGGAVHP